MPERIDAPTRTASSSESTGAASYFSANKRDLAALAILSALTFALAWRFHLFAQLLTVTQRLAGQGDEALVIVVLILAFALKVYSWRRWRELRREIAAHTRAEADLHREQLFSDAVIETAGSLILVLDRQGHIIRFNRACETLTGYRLAEVREQPFWEILLPPEETVRVRGVFADLRAGRYPNTHENHWVTRRGDFRLIAWSNTALLNSAGQVEYIVATGIDITARLGAEAALQESEARFRAIFDGAAVGIGLADLDRHLIACNSAYEHFTGYAEVELRGRPFPTVTHPDDAADDLACYRELVSGARAAYQLEKRYVHRDGAIVWGRLTVSVVKDGTGRAQYSIGMVEDITARKSAETSVHRLELGLTPQEWRVLTLLACDDLTSYRHIGARLYITGETVRDHVKAIGRKLGVSGRRADIVAAAQAQKLIEP